MAELELIGVTVRRNDVMALDGVDLRVPDGSLTAVVGASGSGKTSLLRAIAGLDELTSGAVLLDGDDVTFVKSAERDLSMSFQQPALLPNRSAAQNVAFPLEIRREHVDQIRERVGAEARALQIESLLLRSPKELSVGEVQMVALARALIRAPRVLLLDEPLAPLDASLADVARREMAAIQRGFGVTTVMTTNDPVEAMSMPDQLVVLERGTVVQVGAPIEVYERPDTAASAMFTGDADFLEVSVGADAEGSWLEHPAFRLRSWHREVRRHVHRRLQLVVRPEWLTVDHRGQVAAEVRLVQPVGGRATMWCQIGPHQITVRLDQANALGYRPGDRVQLRIERFVLLDPLDGRRIPLD